MLPTRLWKSNKCWGEGDLLFAVLFSKPNVKGDDRIASNAFYNAVLANGQNTFSTDYTTIARNIGCLLGVQCNTYLSLTRMKPISWFISHSHMMNMFDCHMESAYLIWLDYNCIIGANANAVFQQPLNKQSRRLEDLPAAFKSAVWQCFRECLRDQTRMLSVLCHSSLSMKTHRTC